MWWKYWFSGASFKVRYMFWILILVWLLTKKGETMIEWMKTNSSSLHTKKVASCGLKQMQRQKKDTNDKSTSVWKNKLSINL